MALRTDSKNKKSISGKAYSIVRFAKAIGKNTAEFTTTDMKNFLRWLSDGVLPKPNPSIASFEYVNSGPGPRKVRLVWRQ